MICVAARAARYADGACGQRFCGFTKGSNGRCKFCHTRTRGEDPPHEGWLPPAESACRFFPAWIRIIRMAERDLELCNASVVLLLTTNNQPIRRRRPRRTETPLRGENLAVRRSLSPRPKHCTCGTCNFCEENARWNRIFEEKFADPTYYSRPPVRHPSSLSQM